MNEKKKHKIMLGIEVVLFCMIVAILGTNAASSNPPSNGVSYNKNSQTTVEGALNDLYNKANYGNASASQILKGKTALVGGKKVTGTYEAPTLASQTKDATASAGDILSGKTAYVNGSKITGSMANKGAVSGTVAPGGIYTIPAGYHNGSGKATCSTCESNGYYKIKQFRNVKATVDSYQTFNGNWKSLAKYVIDKNDRGSYVSKFKISLKDDLGINPTEIVDYTVTFSCNVTEGFRISRGYEQNSTTAKYWYSNVSTLLLLSKTTPEINIWGSTSDNSSIHRTNSYIENGTLSFEFSTIRGSNSNGTTNSTYETKCTEFYLSGSIIYKK